MLYKDACNRKSNQQNLGTIKCSNLCTEIVEYTSKDEVKTGNEYDMKVCGCFGSFGFFPLNSFLCLQVAVCNLASLALNMYVTPERTFDFQKLASVTKVTVRNLNKIIDINYYPVAEVRAGLVFIYLFKRFVSVMFIIIIMLEHFIYINNILFIIIFLIGREIKQTPQAHWYRRAGTG